MQETWGQLGEARVWGNGTRVPAPAAAMCNAYQAHNSEFDCVHEEAVVHAMTVVLPVAIAGAERMKGVSGKELITAVALGVDVAAGLAFAATTGLRFFRPATTGAFGGTAALGKLMGLDQAAMVNAFSIAYGQCCGTMQAHTEGSALLAMQMGFNARNAIIACDLAARGFDGPKNVLRRPVRLLHADRDERRAGARHLGSRTALVHNGTRPQALPYGPSHTRHHRGLLGAEAAAWCPDRSNRPRYGTRSPARAPPRWPAAPGANERQLCAFVRALPGRLRAARGRRGARGFHTAGVLRRAETGAGASAFRSRFGTPAIPML